MPPAPVFLNHFFLTLDKPTFAAVKQLDWLRTAFAPHEERTTRRNDSTYTGFYFYGRSTYVEFFEEGSEPGKVKGASGIAFGMESAGGARALAGSGLPEQTLITRHVGETDAPWFHSAAPAGVQRADFFRTWLMEYHADFLRSWHPDLPPPNANSLRRRNVLDRYVAKIGETHHRNDFLLKDVAAININLPEASAEHFTELLTTFDYQFTGSTATGPEIRIATSRARPHGIRSVVFSLQRSVPGDFTLDIGGSRLLLSARGQAVWEFDRAI